MTTRIRAAVFTVVVTVLAGITTVPAAAHVSVDAAQRAPDNRVVVGFVFDHGCSGAATERLVVKFPPGSEPESFSHPPGWTPVVVEDAGSPSIEWAGPPIPDGTRGTFSATVDAFANVGETVRFPTYQYCVNGEEYAWVDTDPQASEPAPALIVTAAIAQSPNDLPDATAASVSTPRGIVGAVVVGFVAAIASGLMTWAWARRRGQSSWQQ